MSLILHSAQFIFSQPGDCCDSAQQELRVTLETGGDGPFLVLNTGRWAINHPQELTDLLGRVQQAAQPVFAYIEGLEP